MASDNWKLPKPIFRSSEGTKATVAKAVRSAEFVEPETLSPDVDENLSSLYLPPEPVAAAAVPEAVASVEIEEQPSISEQLTAERIVPVLPENAGSTKKKGSSFTTVLVVLFFVLAALVAALYYVFFIRLPSDTSV